MHILAQQVLCDFTASQADPLAFKSQRVAVGGQAVVFLVRRGDGKPVWQSHDALAVKIFHSHLTDSDAAAQDEWQSLRLLHTAISGQTIHDLKICAPMPLRLSLDPPALIMTPVTGEPIGTMLTRRRVGEAGRPLGAEPLCLAIAEALDRFWSRTKRIYGDLHLHNILCDPTTRTLTFLDCGMPDDRWLCKDVSRRWHPMSRDLAYLAYYTATSLKGAIRRPRAWRREMRLAQSVLAAYLRRIESAEQKLELLEEIRGCVSCHLAGINVSWSVGGGWRSVVRRAADQSLNKMLNNLRGDVTLAPRGSMNPIDQGAPV